MQGLDARFPNFSPFAQRSVCRGFENALGEVKEGALPVAEIMRIIVHVPDMGHVFLLQECMDALTNTDESIFVAA